MFVDLWAYQIVHQETNEGYWFCMHWLCYLWRKAIEKQRWINTSKYYPNKSSKRTLLKTFILIDSCGNSDCPSCHSSYGKRDQVFDIHPVCLQRRSIYQSTVFTRTQALVPQQLYLTFLVTRLPNIVDHSASVREFTQLDGSRTLIYSFGATRTRAAIIDFILRLCVW